MTNDIYGKGLLSYLDGNVEAVFIVESDLAETEQWPVEIFFRDEVNMPKIEKIALQHTKGTVLDVGAGAGSHALWLQHNGKEVVAMDISSGAVEVMKRRGIRNVLCEDFFSCKEKRYDTLLFLMNGIGITGRLENLPYFFEQAKKMLLPGGKILLDSSDILYLFEEEGSVLLNLNGSYYGELTYTFGFGGEMGFPFEWLFIDFETLSDYAEQYGFSCKKRYENDHYLYLAELRMM